MEIERKYLVRDLPEDLENYPHVEIEQAYLCTSPTLRIRRMGDRYILTVKEHVRVPGTTAIHNREEEFSLSPDAYTRLRAKCEGIPVSKTRYRIPFEGLAIELDIFHGPHAPLLLAEVEFPSTEAAEAFLPPAWLGEDVSGNPCYRNSYLAFHG